MKNWPLKRKFGIYSALLTMISLVASMLAIRPLVLRSQLQELDRELEENAAEIHRDLEEFSNAPANYIRKPIGERFIPPALRRRYYQILGPEGQTLIKSANLGKVDLSSLERGMHTLSINDRNCRIGSFEHGMITINIGTRLGVVEDTQSEIWQAQLIVIPMAGLLVGIAAWWLANRALKPVTDLSAAAQKINANTPEERLPLPPAKDEIFRLTVVLNDSFDRLQKAYAAATRFSADASHQLKTPITVLRAGLDALAKSPQLSDEDQLEIEELKRQTRRLSTLVGDLLLLAQADAGRLALQLTPTDITHCLLACADDVAVLAEEKQLTLEVDVPSNLEAIADSKRMNVILQNLTENAVKYTNPGGKIRLEAGTQDSKVWIRISNTGTPIPEESQAHLFERFFRAHAGENIKGHGLGLNICKSLAEAQGATLELVKSDSENTVFQLTLG